ncbi:hypothetical protein LJ707_02355 [Mucilaginibacter sp. UR6-1]|uniref:hypothetical protein n=1 Tax=Mucilaginibacter sp. UR6-1 TaxID=1435643 RepID=UPI001E5DEDD0|nr:hypothetical protein [Mucilaginibacter sp. UR6-1]MCC8407754.1 hypothetical protein [Mucilaginibacter sp. UR6-1]
MSTEFLDQLQFLRRFQHRTLQSKPSTFIIMKLLAALIAILMPELKSEHVLPVLVLASFIMASLLMRANVLLNCLKRNLKVIKAGCVGLNERLLAVRPEQHFRLCH